MFLDGHKFLSGQALGPRLDQSLVRRLVLAQLHLAVFLDSVGLAGGRSAILTFTIIGCFAYQLL